MSNSKQKIWSEDEVAILKKEYAACSSVEELAERLGRSAASVMMKAACIGIVRVNRLVWTSDMDAAVREYYPCKLTSEVADMLNLTPDQVSRRAKRLGLHKNSDLIAGIGENGMFLKGHIPFNKGMKQSEFMTAEKIGKSMATRFVKGQIPSNIKEIGYERISVDGYVEVKTEKGFVLKHRLLWKEKYGPIPKGYIIRFKNGNKHDVRIENLEMVTLSQNMKDNTIHNYPPEIQTAIRSILNIRRRIKKYEQNNNRQTE